MKTTTKTATCEIEVGPGETLSLPEDFSNQSRKGLGAQRDAKDLYTMK